jgi:hypothetical protein
MSDQADRIAEHRAKTRQRQIEEDAEALRWFKRISELYPYILKFSAETVDSVPLLLESSNVLTHKVATNEPITVKDIFDMGDAVNATVDRLQKLLNLIVEANKSR